MPLHFNGGVKTFLEEKVAIQNPNTMLEWNVNTILELQELFSKKLTPNILENTMCIISRKKTKVDVFYYLPYIHNITKHLIYDCKMQCCFRVNGLDTNKFNLELYNGKKIYTVFSKHNPEKNCLKLSNDGNDNNNWVDRDWIEKVFSI